jgi:hypothetical protein
MTCPTPILVLKSPRPTEESNLDLMISISVGVIRRFAHALVSFLVRCLLVVESSGVLHCDRVALLRFVDAVAFADHGLGDTHVGRLAGVGRIWENVRCGQQLNVESKKRRGWKEVRYICRCGVGQIGRERSLFARHLSFGTLMQGHETVISAGTFSTPAGRSLQVGHICSHPSHSLARVVLNLDLTGACGYTAPQDSAIAPSFWCLPEPPRKPCYPSHPILGALRLSKIMTWHVLQ